MLYTSSGQSSQGYCMYQNRSLMSILAYSTDSQIAYYNVSEQAKKSSESLFWEMLKYLTADSVSNSQLFLCYQTHYKIKLYILIFPLLL